MKFTVQKANILAAMDIAIRVIPAKTTQPILECFLIEVDGMEGYITGTGGLQSIKTGFTCMAEESGKVCIEAKLLMNAIKKMGKSDISFQSEGNAVIVSGAKARYEFPTRQIEEYPNFPVFGDAFKVTVDAMRFGSMIDGVSFAVSQKESNKAATGINLDIKNGNLRLSALDMVRVAIRNCGIQQEIEQPLNVTIPADTMISVARSVTDGDLEIEIGKLQVRFTFGNTTIVSRTYDNKFFNVEQMINQNMPHKIRCNRKEILESIDRASVIRQDNTPLVFEVKGDNIRLSMQTSLSQFEEEVACENDGADVRIGANSAYLLDALKAIDDDMATIELDKPTMPLYVVDDVAKDYIYLILPVNLG